jgi:hypothetical protein
MLIMTSHWTLFRTSLIHSSYAQLIYFLSNLILSFYRHIDVASGFFRFSGQWIRTAEADLNFRHCSLFLLRRPLFWAVTPCGLVEHYYRFSGICCPCLQFTLDASSPLYNFTSDKWKDVDYLKTEEADFSESPLTIYQTTRCNISEYSNLHIILESCLPTGEKKSNRLVWKCLHPLAILVFYSVSG